MYSRMQQGNEDENDASDLWAAEPTESSDLDYWHTKPELISFSNLFVHHEHVAPGPSSGKMSDYLRTRAAQAVVFCRNININFVRDLYDLNLRYPYIFTNDYMKENLKPKHTRKCVVVHTGPMSLYNGASITVAPVLCRSKHFYTVQGVYPLSTYEVDMFSVAINELLIFLKILLDITTAVENKLVLEREHFWDIIATIAYKNMDDNFLWKYLCDAVSEDMNELFSDGMYSGEVIKTICEINDRYWGRYIDPNENPKHALIYRYIQPLVNDNENIMNCVTAIKDLPDIKLPDNSSNKSLNHLTDINNTHYGDAKEELEKVFENRKKMHASIMALMTYFKRFRPLVVAKIVGSKNQEIEPGTSMDIVTS